ncbi:MAG: antibiotic biosynthesis monooxygenase [Thaumarchaeota archaeon]|nr:antibiotic biosynthesis monooxygenase [Nitrososphaerota archaeon]
MDKTRYARIITMKAKPGKGDEFVRTFRDRVAPTGVELEGIRRMYLLRAVGKNDEFVVVSLWDGEEAAEKYAKSGNNKRYGAILASVQEGKERVRKFHVELHSVGKTTRRRKKD